MNNRSVLQRCGDGRPGEENDASRMRKKPKHDGSNFPAVGEIVADTVSSRGNRGMHGPTNQAQLSLGNNLAHGSSGTSRYRVRYTYRRSLLLVPVGCSRCLSPFWFARKPTRTRTVGLAGVCAQSNYVSNLFHNVA